MSEEKKPIISTNDFGLVTGMIIGIENKLLKEKLRDFFIETIQENQKNILINAIIDGHTNQEEIDMLMKKYDVKEDVISEIFKHKYDEGIKHDDGKEDNSMYMLTIDKTTGLYKMKDYVKERFGLIVLLPHEAIEKFEEEDNFENKVSNYIG